VVTSAWPIPTWHRAFRSTPCTPVYSTAVPLSFLDPGFFSGFHNPLASSCEAWAFASLPPPRFFFGCSDVRSPTFFFLHKETFLVPMGSAQPQVFMVLSKFPPFPTSARSLPYKKYYGPPPPSTVGRPSSSFPPGFFSPPPALWV